ncbi:SseB family protein [Nocardioides abyssi]|uniref:SseB family protein n=1 Tax=Nocardioides abyssi TaxID=3058370 RepID=A0ABT8ETU6_9ACTN|nr:SseB family protein [Nocardioides abyssi]MDN4161524.1 SseB family protein [Nocardioides abyssi]
MSERPERPDQKRLLGPGFPDDTGEAPPGLVAAATAYASDRRRYVDVLAALAECRLLVPVVAVLGEVEVDEQGLAHDKTSDMAAVLLTGADGRLALLAFSGTSAMAAWDPAARPVPVPARVAAQSTVQEGAAALLVDVAGPVRLVVEGEDLHALAAGWTLARVGEQRAWIRPGDSADPE